MGDMNAKIGVGTDGRQKLIVRHGVRAEMNGNGGRWAHFFFQVDELVRGGTQCRQRNCHKRTRISPGGKTEHQLHMARSSPQNIRVMCGVDVGSFYRLLMAKVRKKFSKIKKDIEVAEVTRLRVFLKTKDAFTLRLQNRFECLQHKEEEPLVDDKWRQIKKGYLEACEEVLGNARSNRKQ